VTTTITTIAAGHPTTLRSLSLKYRTDIFTLVIGFLALPTLTLASLLCCFWRSVRKALRDRRTGPGADFSYYVCAALGMEAVPIPSKNPESKPTTTKSIEAGEGSELSVCLYRLKYSSIQIVSKEYYLR
jgi:hypothetical protein